jgi:hypothetical protein
LADIEKRVYNEGYSTQQVRDMAMMDRLFGRPMTDAMNMNSSFVQIDRVVEERYEPWTVQIRGHIRGPNDESVGTREHIHVIAGDRTHFNMGEFYPGMDVEVEIPDIVGGIREYFYQMPGISTAMRYQQSHPFVVPETHTFRITTLSGPSQRMRNMENQMATTGYVQDANMVASNPPWNNVSIANPMTYTTYATPTFTGTPIGTTVTQPTITPILEPYEEGQGSDAIVSNVSDLKQALRDHLKLETRIEVVGTELCLKVELSFDDEVIAEIDDAVDLAEVLDNLEN